YADGYGLKSIAKAMNADPSQRLVNAMYFGDRGRIDSPRTGTGSWSGSAINAILKNERYIGRIVYGKYKNVDKAGRTRLRERQPEGSWIAKEIPELRIIPPDLW